MNFEKMNGWDDRSVRGWDDPALNEEFANVWNLESGETNSKRAGNSMQGSGNSFNGGGNSSERTGVNSNPKLNSEQPNLVNKNTPNFHPSFHNSHQSSQNGNISREDPFGSVWGSLDPRATVPSTIVSEAPPSPRAWGS